MCRGGRPDICRDFVSCVDAFLDMGGVTHPTQAQALLNPNQYGASSADLEVQGVMYRVQVLELLW